MAERVELAVVGAGAVGCAIAARLAPHASTLVLEAGPREGEGVSSRNSGVIHSGLYYRPGSRKATGCVRGQALLYEWARRREVPHAATGKLVVARDRSDREALEALASNARASGARGVRLVSGAEAASREPALPAVDGALWCPWSGVVDPAALVRSLRVEAEHHDAYVAFEAPVHAMRADGSGWVLETARGPVAADAVVNAAGLHADRVASLAGHHGHRIHPSRGDYYRLRLRRRYRRLLYPVRRSDRSGLGIHLTLELDGGLRLGPDARWVDRRNDLGPPDETLRDRFHEAGQRLLGPFSAEALTWDGAGIRPKLHGPDDRGADRADDFVLVEDPPGCLHLLGIESPGLTAALALAEEVEGWLRGAPRGG